MTTIACPKCGAALEVPSAASTSVRCQFCRAEIPSDAILSAEVVAAHRLDAAIGAKLDAHAARSRALQLALALGLGILGIGVLGAVVLLRATPAQPESASLARASSTAESARAAVAPPAAPEPTPAAPAAPAAPGALAAPTAATPRVTFGGEGTGEGRIAHPKALAVAADGTVYVADRTQRIQAFDATGRLLRTLVASTTRTASGPLDEDITEIEGLAATHDGKLWVSIGYDLQQLDATTGRVLHTTRGAPGRSCFRDIAIDPRGELHVNSACTATNRYALVHLDARGRELHRYADPPDYDRAASGRVAVDGAGRWYVGYGTLSEVRVLEPDGSVFTRFGRRGRGPGEFQSFALDAVALDPEGRVYVRDGGMIRIFASDGHFLRDFDPDALGSMRTFVIGADGTLWVVTGDGRIGAFAPLTF